MNADEVNVVLLIINVRKIYNDLLTLPNNLNQIPQNIKWNLLLMTIILIVVLPTFTVSCHEY